MRSRNDHPLIYPSRQALVRALDVAQRRLLDAAVRVAEASDCPLWLVGGAVRDLALGQPLRDLDFATDGDPASLVTALGRAHGAAVRLEPRFGTAHLTFEADGSPTAEAAPRIAADFAALRTERYVRPGVLPTVRLGTTLEDDIARRDFTVNAMALLLTGSALTDAASDESERSRLVDPFDGFADLQARRLRVLHALSFVDDATRLWRAARFAARFGLRPDRATAALIEDGARWIHSISARRLWNEFALVAAEARPGAVVRLLQRWGVLRAVHPTLDVGTESARALARLPSCAPELLFALLAAPLDAGSCRDLGARLGVPSVVTRTAEDAARLLAAVAELSTGAEGVAPDLLAALENTSALARTAALRLDPAGQRPLQRALRRWEGTRSPLSAEELLEQGVPRGPRLSELLHQLRRERYLGTLRSAADARRYVYEAIAATVGKPSARRVNSRSATRFAVGASVTPKGSGRP